MVCNFDYFSIEYTKMVCIREDNEIDFTDYKVFEMIQAFWVDCIKSRNKNWKYYWWRLENRKKLIRALEKKID